jgi:putative ABC transport system ATP-binding protein
MSRAHNQARPALVADGLYRFFHAGDEERVALHDVSLGVERGELSVVVGPSGSGKSTLLACLAGLDEPDGGTVWIDGRRLSRLSEHARAAVRGDHVGVLFQAGNLLDHLSVDENLRLARRFSQKQDRPDPHVLLEELGIASRAAALPSQLSGGEAARAGLAVAMANSPAVLLADEPTAELDERSAGQVIELLRRVADRGAAVVVATHDRQLRSRADRGYVLRDGSLEA